MSATRARSSHLGLLLAFGLTTSAGCGGDQQHSVPQGSTTAELVKTPDSTTSTRIGIELKGIKLGSSLKEIQQNGMEWTIYDYQLLNRGEDAPLDPKAPARLYSQINVPRKIPRIDVFGDNTDLDYAKAVGIQVFYLNYDSMGINKDDFIRELSGRWGEPNHCTVLGSEMTYYWFDSTAHSAAILELNQGQWGPRMVLSLFADGRHITAHDHSADKVKDILK